MSYQNLKSRLTYERERIWAELEEARATDVDKELEEMGADEIQKLHGPEVRRLFAGCGLRAVANSIASIEKSLARNRDAIGNDSKVEELFESFVTVAENVARHEVETFKKAHQAYQDAQGSFG